jgi:arylamine N-acetyltransferase
MDRYPIRLSSAILQRYLNLLGVPKHSPSLAGLRELVFAHLTHVPFENISKLLYKRNLGLQALPSMERYLEGINFSHFGGTCYSNNFYFYCLLVTLGYEANLCAADMATPDVHAVSIVAIEGREFLIDTGYAAPFFAPLPRDLDCDHIVTLGRDRYILKPRDETGCSRLELHRSGVLKHGYLVKPAPKRIEDFGQVIENSFRADATFLNSILLARFFPGRSVVIHNFSLIESCGESCQIYPLCDLRAVENAIHKHFEIPQNLIAEALSSLGDMQDAWGDPFLGGRTNA